LMVFVQPQFTFVANVEGEYLGVRWEDRMCYAQ
jgi:hypothetical protein